MLSALDAIVFSPRVRLIATAVLVAQALTLSVWLAGVHGLLDAFREPVGGDFIIFYATSKLTLLGRAAQAFDPAALRAVERAVVPAWRGGLKWCYPPTYQLLIAPLALIPFAWAYPLFLAVTGAPFLALMRRIGGRGPWPILLALAFPGTFGDAMDGQNGLLTAALLGWGLLAVERRPWLGGAMLGLLVYKPQFGLLLPVLLIGTGNWRAAAGAAASGAGLMTAATLAFGLQPWAAFVHTLPQVSATLADGALPWSKMPTVMVGLRSIGVSKAAASGAQAAVAAAVAALTLACWRRPAPHGLKVATAVCAVLLVTPYAFNYDLVLLAAPIALVAAELRGWERRPRGAAALLAFAFVLPSASVTLAQAAHVQPTAPVLLLIFAALAHLTWRAGAAPSVAAEARDRLGPTFRTAPAP